jgi:hypothetical protein
MILLDILLPMDITLVGILIVDNPENENAWSPYDDESLIRVTITNSNKIIIPIDVRP